MALGFIKTYRGAAGQLLTTDPKAYLVLSLIALRARREDDTSGLTNLKVNQAFIGDYKKLGLTRDCYRGAIKRLVKQGFIMVHPTPKGTIATLTSIAIHDINAQESPFEYPPQFSMGNAQPHPSAPHSSTVTPPVTRREEDIRKTTTTNKSLYTCLLPAELPDEDKYSLMQYPEDRVQLALQYIAVADIKTTVIQTLHWHCREPKPPQLSKQSRSLQEKIGREYNDFLFAHGFAELAGKNEAAMKENYLHVFLDGRKTTITLKQEVDSLKRELEKSREEIKFFKDKKL